jgi:hypothetical protein
MTNTLILLSTILQMYTNQVVVGVAPNGDSTVITRVVTQRHSTYLASSLEGVTLTTNVIPSVVQPRPNPVPVTNATPGMATNMLKTVPPVRHGPPTNSPAYKRMQEREAMKKPPAAPTNAVIVK